MHTELVARQLGLFILARLPDVVRRMVDHANVLRQHALRLAYACLLELRTNNMVCPEVPRLREVVLKRRGSIARACPSFRANVIAFLLLTTFSAVSGRLLEQHAFCEAHGLKPNIHRKPKIFDTFLLNHEADMLEIRIFETAKYVDYFVITESPVSTTGTPRRMMYDDIKDRLGVYKDQIIYNPLLDAGPGRTTWKREAFMRNQLFTPITGLSSGDILLVSDVDEIVRPEVLRVLKECKGYNDKLQFMMQLYYYSFSVKHTTSDGWGAVKGQVYQDGQRLLKPQELRDGLTTNQVFNNSGWHLSNGFRTVDQMRNKILTYTHTELFNKKFLTKDWIVQKFRKGEDIFDRRSERYVFAEPDDIPAYVRGQARRFHYLLERRGPDAGFED